MAKIEITWVREPHPSIPNDVRTTASVAVNHEFSTEDHTEILNTIYRDTNLYSGEFWNAIENIMPTPRPHTALSVGDEVEIDGVFYAVADFGFERL